MYVGICSNLFHPLGFKEYQEQLKGLLSSHKLLLWSLFFDEYQKSRNEKQMLDAVVLRLDMTQNVFQSQSNIANLLGRNFILTLHTRTASVPKRVYKDSHPPISQ